MPNKNDQNFWDKLKSRNVIRVAIAYSITAWLLMQIASIILPAFEAPNWVLKVVIFLLLLGLPIALSMSWFFEMTSDGLKKSKNVTLEESDRGGKKVRNVIYIVLSLSVLYLLYDKFNSVGHKPFETTEIVEVYIPEKSIAVLPFRNLSGSEENEFFANAIMEAILNDLSRLKDIKVVSRTSVERYKESKLPIKQIGKELEIAYILEGSVQRNGDRVRINANLISAKTDKQLWSENYDRDTEDIFKIQSEIATAISDNLELLINSNERELMENSPTSNLKAFDLYLQALHIEKNDVDNKNVDMENKLLEQAVSLDPDFFYPYLEIADNVLNRAFIELTPDDKWKDTVLSLIDKSIELSPNRYEGYMYKGYYYYRINERENYLFYLYKTLEFLPNSPYIQSVVGEDKLKKGLIDEGVELKLKALTSIPGIEVRESKESIKGYLNKLDFEFRFKFLSKKFADYVDVWYNFRKGKFKENIKIRLAGKRNFDLPQNKVILASAYLDAENYEKAITLFEERMSQSVGSNQGSMKWSFEHRYAYALIKGGQKKKGEGLLKSYIDTLQTNIAKHGVITGSERYDLALSYAIVGNKEKAFEWLKIEMEDPNSKERTAYYIADAMLDPIRDKPEVKALIKKEILDKETAISKVFHKKLKEYQARGELLWLNLDED